MAAKKTPKILRDIPTPKIVRNYDLYSMEERIHNLEINGGGGGAESWDYSKTETDTHQKWIDGKTIYSRVVEVNPGTITQTGWQTVGTIDFAASVDTLINMVCLEEGTGKGVYCAGSYLYANGNLGTWILTGETITKVILFYTKVA